MAVRFTECFFVFTGNILGIPCRGSLTREGTTIEALSSIRLDLLIVELVIHFLFDFEVICWFLVELVSGGAICPSPYCDPDSRLRKMWIIHIMRIERSFGLNSRENAL